MDFREALKAAADECVKQNQSGADHLIKQAFFEGVRFYMEYSRPKPTPPTDSTSQP